MGLAVMKNTLRGKDPQRLIIFLHIFLITMLVALYISSHHRDLTMLTPIQYLDIHERDGQLVCSHWFQVASSTDGMCPKLHHIPYTVHSENIQTTWLFPHLVTLQPYSKIETVSPFNLHTIPHNDKAKTV